MARTRQALIDELGRAMQAYQRSTQAFDDEVGRALDLNPADLRCLDWLTEGPMTASRIAEATGLSTAATTSMIDRLERKGFVQRRRHETDRRQVLVEMTPDGLARTWAVYGPLVAAGMPLLTRLGVEQLAAMRDHLIAIREITDEERRRLQAGTTPSGRAGDRASSGRRRRSPDGVAAAQDRGDG